METVDVISTTAVYPNISETLTHVDVSEDSYKVVSDHFREMFEITFFIFATGLLGIFGISTNGINIVVFLKQGLQESSTVSLLCLSCSDLGVSFLISVGSVLAALNKLFGHGYPIDWNAVQLVVSGAPLMYFSKLSMVTTMCLCLERCLCVVRPLAVKTIFTKRRTIIILTVLYLELAVSYGVYLSMTTLEYQHDSMFNITRLTLKTHPWAPVVQAVHHSFISSVHTVVCVVSVSVSSVVMTVGVYRAAQRRALITQNKSTDLSSPSDLSTRDVRLIKMVSFISVLFLCSYLPALCMEFVEAFIEPELDMFGKYHNINEVMWSLITAVSAFNASGNIIVYLLVSERYNQVFRQIFRLRDSQQ